MSQHPTESGLCPTHIFLFENMIHNFIMSCFEDSLLEEFNFQFSCSTLLASLRRLTAEMKMNGEGILQLVRVGVADNIS